MRLVRAYASSAGLRPSPLKLLLHPELGKVSVIFEAMVWEPVPRTAPAQLRVDSREGDAHDRCQVLGLVALFPQGLEVLPGLKCAESVASHCFTSFLA